MQHAQINIYSIGRWLIVTAAAYVRRHPFFCSSIVIHLALLYVIFTYGSYQVNLYERQAAQLDVAQSIQRAQQMDLQKRVNDMEKIKQLLQKSIAKPNAENQSQGGSGNDSNALTPEELLAKAEEIAKAIKALDKDIKADDLSKLLDISKEEALKKVEEQLANEHAKALNVNTSKDIKQLEADARSALEDRKKTLEEKEQGTKIEIAKDMPDAEKNKVNASHDAQSKGDADGKGSGKHGAGGDSESMAAKGSGSATKSSGHAQVDEGSELQRHEIAEFLVDSSYAMNGDQFFDTRVARMPTVSGTEKKQSGRILGAGGVFAERVYLNAWYVIGPFKGNSRAALYHNPSYPPEQLVDLDAVYFGKDERILKWQYVVNDDYPFVPPDGEEDAVYYGYTEVSMAQAQDIWMWCGGDDDLQVWLNDHLAWAGGNIAKQDFFDKIYGYRNNYAKLWNLTEGKRLVHFKQGRNKLFFKLSNGPNRLGVFASIILTK
jgi:hypothetical protein